jgi:hypothetical protein
MRNMRMLSAASVSVCKPFRGPQLFFVGALNAQHGLQAIIRSVPHSSSFNPVVAFVGHTGAIRCGVAAHMRGALDRCGYLLIKNLLTTNSATTTIPIQIVAVPIGAR